MNYLLDLGFDDNDITIMNGSVDKQTLDGLILFPKIVKLNYEYLKNIGIKNYKEIFMQHTHMFLLDPNKFNAIFEKYDHDDLIRCLEKNGAVIEKL